MRLWMNWPVQNDSVVIHKLSTIEMRAQFARSTVERMTKKRPSPTASTALGIMTSTAGVGWLSGALAPLWEAVDVETGRRRSVALRAAERLSGVTREELAERIEASPQGRDRLIRLLYLAGWNGHDEPLKMMGRCLVRGLEATETGDAERAAQEAAILDSLHMMEPRHVRMLAAIEQTPGIANGPLAEAVAPWDAFPERTAVELLGRGLVDDPYGRYAGPGPGERRFFHISPLGSLLLRAAAEVALLDD